VAAYLHHGCYHCNLDAIAFLGQLDPHPKISKRLRVSPLLFTAWDELRFVVTTCVGAMLLIALANRTASIHDYSLV
jgi:hypothetical protein